MIGSSDSKSSAVPELVGYVHFWITALRFLYVRFLLQKRLGQNTDRERISLTNQAFFGEHLITIKSSGLEWNAIKASFNCVLG